MLQESYFRPIVHRLNIAGILSAGAFIFVAFRLLPVFSSSFKTAISVANSLLRGVLATLVFPNHSGRRYLDLSLPR